jgi:hypothetical protein
MVRKWSTVPISLSYTTPTMCIAPTSQLTRGAVAEGTCQDYAVPRSLFSGGSTRFAVGYWESVRCAAPAVAFPSDRVYLGVSNDGGA